MPCAVTANRSAVALLRLLPFLFPVAFVWAALANSISALYLAVAMHVIIIGSENTLGRYFSNTPIPPLVAGSCLFEDWCLLAWPAAHFAALTAALTLIAEAGPSLHQVFAIGAIFGYSINIFSATVGHEMLHRRSPATRFCSDILYTAMLYPHFPAVHLMSHHRWAGSDRDCQTPRAGQPIYPFLMQALWGGLRMASTDQAAALDPHLAWRILAVAPCMAAIAIVGSLDSVMFFVVQGLFSFILVETINYIQHYAPTTLNFVHKRSAIVNQDLNFVSRSILLNLPLHTAHHENENLHYACLAPTSRAPTCCWGYWTSFWLAWTPPLWKYLHGV